MKETGSMKQFQNFDEYYHKKTRVPIGSAVYEIWHQKTLSEIRVREIAERIHSGELESGKEPLGLNRLDFRDLHE
jgi:hypothetical protein